MMDFSVFDLASPDTLLAKTGPERLITQYLAYAPPEDPLVEDIYNTFFDQIEVALTEPPSLLEQIEIFEAVHTIYKRTRGRPERQQAQDVLESVSTDLLDQVKKTPPASLSLSEQILVFKALGRVYNVFLQTDLGSGACKAGQDLGMLFFEQVRPKLQKGLSLSKLIPIFQIMWTLQESPLSGGDWEAGVSKTTYRLAGKIVERFSTNTSYALTSLEQIQILKAAEFIGYNSSMSSDATKQWAQETVQPLGKELLDQAEASLKNPLSSRDLAHVFQAMRSVYKIFFEIDLGQRAQQMSWKAGHLIIGQVKKPEGPVSPLERARLLQPVSMVLQSVPESSPLDSPVKELLTTFAAPLLDQIWHAPKISKSQPCLQGMRDTLVTPVLENERYSQPLRERARNIQAKIQAALETMQKAVFAQKVADSRGARGGGSSA